MTMRFLLFAFTFLTGLGYAQTAAPGVLSEWEVRRMLENLATQAKHLGPVMNDIQPQDWIRAGASPTYLEQWNHSKADLKYLLDDTSALQAKPERLTLALDTYFRMTSLEKILASVLEGARKYQSPELARRVQDVINENSANRDTLRQYVQDLAAQKEQECDVSDREAQRCRSAMLKDSAGSQKKRKN